MLAVTSITFFSVADVKCGLCEINKSNRANATNGLSLVENGDSRINESDWLLKYMTGGRLEEVVVEVLQLQQ